MTLINLNLKDEKDNAFAVITVDIKTGVDLSGTGHGIEIRPH